MTGAKTVLAQRILECMSIDEAIRVVTEYRTWVVTSTAKVNKNTDSDQEDDDMGSKMDEESVDEEEITLEADKKAQDLETKRLREKKRSLDKGTVASDLAKAADETTKLSDIEMSSGIAGGESSFLDDSADEAGFRVKGKKKKDSDDDSVVTQKNSNIPTGHTRIGLMLTPPPCSTAPDKQLALQAQKWFKK